MMEKSKTFHNRGKDLIILPLVCVLLNVLVLYFVLAPIVKPYSTLFSWLVSSHTGITSTDRYNGVVQNLANTDDKIAYSSIGALIPGDQIGEISITEANLTAPLYFGDSTAQLNSGAGLYINAGIPGQNTTVLLAGHAGTFFHNLDKAQEDMIIRVETFYGVYEYRITGTKVASDTDESAYDLTKPQENIILYTCYPLNQIGYTDKRLFVYGEYVSGPLIDYTA